MSVPTPLVKGQNGPLAAHELRVSVRSAAVADLSALLVTAAGKVRTDADFVFFNQPAGPGVQLHDSTLTIDLAAVPADIAQLRAVLTLADDGATFGEHAAPTARVTDDAGAVLYEYRIDGLTSESIVIALELYRRGSDWKVRAVGQGYAGGFAELVTDHGVSVDEEPPVRSVPEESKLSFEKKAKLDLRKRAVASILMTKGANDIRARVVLVVDKTGSMNALYRLRVVHRVVERMVPIAIQIDDDGLLEPYLYADHFARLPSIAVHEVDSWCETFLHLRGTHGGIDYAKIGGANNEVPIISEIVSSLRSGDTVPTLVLFFTDGGFSKRGPIRRLLQDASALPAFWQFIGLGKAEYGLLQELDDLDGRVVNNAGFFPIDDIEAIDDAELYRRLLSEFPDWLRAAKDARIVGSLGSGEHSR